MSDSRLVWTSDTEAARRWALFIKWTAADFQERQRLRRCRVMPIECNPDNPGDIDWVIWDPSTGEYSYN